MSYPLLYLATAAIPLISLIGLAAHVWRQRHPQDLTTTQWREEMRKLEPSNPPQFRNKHVSKGAPGVCYPEKKMTKIAVVKRTVAK